MKIKDFVGVTINRANNQKSFTLKARALKQAGLTPEQLLQITIPKPKSTSIFK